MRGFPCLPYTVQVIVTGSGGGQWWETIAAFDVEKAAKAYAEQCRHPDRPAYRVVAMTGNTID